MQYKKVLQYNISNLVILNISNKILNAFII